MTTSPVVVIGAGGYVGSRLVASLARAGRLVLAASRLPGLSLTDGGPGQPVPVSDGGPGPGLVRPVTYADAAGLGDAVRDACDRDAIPLPGGAAASIGGWHLGARLLDEPDLDAWRATLDSHLTAHLEAARALAPLLRESADPAPAHVILNGAARAEPMTGSGRINVTGAALSMLVQVLRHEESTPDGAEPRAPRTGQDNLPHSGADPAVSPRPRPIRFHELVIDHAVAGDDRNVTPERTVTPAAVVDTLSTILDDPTTAAVVHVP